MEQWRQFLHIEPPEGWMNDPNGLCCFDGKYHVYFQYSPGSPEGATLRCWGHYAGENLLRMQYEGMVLQPDIPEDRTGVFSGSAIVENGLLHIFYTGNVEEEGDYDYVTSGRGANVIHVTSSDGHRMSAKQVVLRNADYPEWCSCHVRDPKVWKEGKCWKMVLGARTLEDHGCVLIYRSEDLENWEYVTSVAVPEFGYMWECPDFFKLGGRGFLSFSPQGLPHYEMQYQNANQSGYMPVKGDLTENSFEPFREWDMGFDFYAPQSFEDMNGRRILIGWMGMGDNAYGNHTIARGWQHCLTIPRELSVGADGKLHQKPIREIEALRGEKKVLIGKDVPARSGVGGKRVESVGSEDDSRYLEKLSVDGLFRGVALPFDLSATCVGDFVIDFDSRLIMNYDKKSGVFAMTFQDEQYGAGRTVRKASVSDCTNVRIIADMSSIEVYLNDGEVVMSTRFYPDEELVNVRMAGTGDAEIFLMKS